MDTKADLAYSIFSEEIEQITQKQKALASTVLKLVSSCSSDPERELSKITTLETLTKEILELQNTSCELNRIRKASKLRYEKERKDAQRDLELQRKSILRDLEIEVAKSLIEYGCKEVAEMVITSNPKFKQLDKHQTVSKISEIYSVYKVAADTKEHIIDRNVAILSFNRFLHKNYTFESGTSDVMMRSDVKNYILPRVQSNENDDDLDAMIADLKTMDKMMKQINVDFIDL